MAIQSASKVEGTFGTNTESYTANMRQKKCEASFTFAMNLNRLRTSKAYCDVKRIGAGAHGNAPVQVL
jgi:hypothetical protein